MLMLCYDNKNYNSFMAIFTHTSIIETISRQRRSFLFFLGLVGLFLFAVLFTLLYSTLARQFLPELDYASFINSQVFLSYINFSTYIVLFGTILFYLRSFLISLLKVFLNFNNFKKGFMYGLVIIGLNIFLGVIYQVLNIQTTSNNNQELINSLVFSMPVISIITFVFLGPIVEEFTYRLGLFSLIAEKNKWLAYIITMIIFGFIHFDFTTTNITNELLNMPFYLLAGLAFCYIFYKENFAVVTYAHILNNFISVLSIFALNQITPP
jgi:membrane protease YdiL (CAAX protease family)